MKSKRFINSAILCGMLLSHLSFGGRAEDISKLLAEGKEYKSKKEFIQAKDSFLKAALMGDVNSQFELLSLIGEPGITEKIITFELGQAIKDASAGSNPLAWYNLGFIYRHGWEGNPPHDEKGFEWYSKAANAGNLDAMRKLGYMYERGWKGHPPNHEKAIEWYTKAASAGDSAAMNKLGTIYWHGWEDHPPDYEKALEWYTKAARAGNPEAMYNLGLMYRSGWKGHSPNYMKAIEWYTQAVRAGNPEAMYNLGYMYQSGWEGHPPDYKKAMEWYTQAADAGNSNAMNNLGVIYQSGWEGHLPDYKKAMEWSTQAARAGNAVAMSNLGLMYMNGAGSITSGGIPKNPGLAAQWFEKAKAAGKLNNDIFNYYTKNENGVFVALESQKMPADEARRVVEKVFTKAKEKKVLRDSLLEKQKKLKELKEKNLAMDTDKINELEEKIDSLTEEIKCPVCYDCFSDRDSFVVANCNHDYCDKCYTAILQKFKGECHFCRSNCGPHPAGIIFDDKDERSATESKKETHGSSSSSSSSSSSGSGTLNE